MPHRAYQSQQISVDALMSIADGGEDFKGRLEQFCEAKRASESAARVAGKAEAGSAASLRAVFDERLALNERIEAHDKQIEKEERRLARIKSDALRTQEQAEILSVEVARQKTEADERDLSLNARHDEQEAREARQNSRDVQQNSKSETLAAYDNSLIERESKLNTSVRDLNERIDGFRVGA